MSDHDSVGLEASDATYSPSQFEDCPKSKDRHRNLGMVQVEVAEPRPSGSGIHYEIAGNQLPDGRGSATECASN